MKRLLTTFIYCVFFTNILSAFQGFAAGTMVKTSCGYANIENIKSGDGIIAYCQGRCVERQVVSVYRSKVPYFYKISIGGEIICAASGQQWYIPGAMTWVKTSVLTSDDFLGTNDGLLCCDDIVRIDEEIEVFDFTIADDHNFCVTRYDLVVHNFVPIVVGLSWLIGAGAVEFAGFSFATVMAGIAAGVIVHNKDSKNDIEFKLSQNLDDITAGGGSPNDPDEDSFFGKLKSRASKVIRTKRFGKLYEDSNTKLWWSKDRANHGGSQYKVYKKVGKGLKWLYDADRYGNKIVGKHKGPTGLFIPNRELISCQ